MTKPLQHFGRRSESDDAPLALAEVRPAPPGPPCERSRRCGFGGPASRWPITRLRRGTDTRIREAHLPPYRSDNPRVSDEGFIRTCLRHLRTAGGQEMHGGLCPIGHAEFPEGRTHI